jgi:sec-independent protein translocase protein TatA
MGPIGMQEMVVIFLVALVLFGPKKLPELGKTIAKAMTEFRRAQSDLKATYEREMQAIERESESLKEVTRQAADAITSSYSSEDNHTPFVTPEDTLNHPSVSASAVPGAESHAELPEVPLVTAHPPDEAVTAVTLGVEGTVPRTTSSAVQTVAATTAPHIVDTNPLPEFEQADGNPAAKKPDTELPSIG